MVYQHYTEFIDLSQTLQPLCFGPISQFRAYFENLPVFPLGDAFRLLSAKQTVIKSVGHFLA